MVEPITAEGRGQDTAEDEDGDRTPEHDEMHDEDIELTLCRSD